MPTISTKRLGINLTVAWVVSPIALLIMWFVIVGWDEFSAPTILVSCIFVTPYILGTVYFGYRVLLDTSTAEKIALLMLPVSLVAYFVYRNLTPYSVFLADGEHDAPGFDKAWFYWPQTAYGYPAPVVRLFDKELPVEPFGLSLVDVSSLFFNVWNLFGVLFAVFAAEAVLNAWRSGKSTADKRGLANARRAMPSKEK